jgi:hypothetical protein
MKKAKILMATGIFFLSGMMFTACGSEGTNAETQETAKKEVYQCPMDCENGKTYGEPGKCPVCEMDIKRVDA